MPRRPLTDVEWRRSLQRRRMLDAERKRRLREDNAYRVLERARNREARRKQRENPKFREAERARAHAYYVRPFIITFDDGALSNCSYISKISLSSTATSEGIICGSCGLILNHVKALRTHRAEFHPRQVLCLSRMSFLENVFKPSSKDVPPCNDGSAVDFNKLAVNAVEKEHCGSNGKGSVEIQMNAVAESIEHIDSAEHSLVDFYGIIFSDVKAAVDRMLSCKLKKHQSYDLQTHLAIEAKLGELLEYVLEMEKTVEKLAAYGTASSNFKEEQKLSTPADLISLLRNFIFHGVPPALDGLLFESGEIKREELHETNAGSAEK
uniref:C2H2-type domain-containing protein n=1 Tax=Elaeophora elaphi TaxID=1147741 RepID=A0A0R3RPP8_9BILA